MLQFGFFSTEKSLEMNRKVLDPIILMSILTALLFVYKSAEIELGEKPLLERKL